MDKYTTYTKSFSFGGDLILQGLSHVFGNLV